MLITDFHNRHAGETCVLVGNAPNLHLTPPEWFNYPSFGVNTCHLWAGPWMPTYYTGVDKRLWLEFGEAIYAKFHGIPKFIPTPKLEVWQGDNFYRWLHRPGELYEPGHSTSDRDVLTKFGLAYRSVMNVALMLAHYMGFKTILMIGVQHKPDNMREHFWGVDAGMGEPKREIWMDAYRECVRNMPKVRVLNISEDTYVPADVLPRGDWQEWRTYESQTV